ncbi:Tigger transposable element-derived protein 1-like 91 [Homarus americanus]|uniref:Tigger transposable element-derived protein 1-like 91 n=1 Tax=Homarus americanus TaxID=6706 RepID=A0A8J5JWL0_HOMAM|nr:Tigger transposable element-derived protein 1-like 91 [Homarus americanus]
MGIAEPKPFTASSGWLQGFKKWNKITNINIVGEGGSADCVAASDFPPILREVMEEGQYTNDQVFNMDESGLFWKKLPSKTFVVKSASKCWGRKLQKERITVFFTTNASGTCKLKLSVIHTALKQHAYKNMDMTKLNVHWLTARKAWMFSTLSLSCFDDCFVPDAKKFCEQRNVPFNILLLLDNAPGHSRLLKKSIPGVRQRQPVTVAVDLAREAAQSVTAAGFSETTNDDIMEVIRDPEVTADEMLDDDDVTREKQKLTHGNVKDAIEMYHEHINTSRQRNITDFFARNPPQPAQVSDSDSDGDFEGFVREGLISVVDSDSASPEGH